MLPAVSRVGFMVAACLGGGAAQPVERSTIPHDCVNDNLPYQLITTIDAFELHSWDWATGERSVHWKLQQANHPNVTRVNACGIDPEDNIAYCIVYRNGGYLGRLDKNGIAYVARTPGGEFSVSASFDENGTFWATTRDEIWKLKAPHNLKGWSEPSADLPKLRVVGNTSMNHGADIVAWQDHIVSVRGSKVILTDLSDKNLETWEAKPSLADPMEGGFGGAYLYSGSLYFSANGGKGVYRIEPDLKLRTFIGTRVGASFDTNNNDGLNCIFTESPDEVGRIKDAGFHTSMLGASIVILSLLGHLMNSVGAP